MYHSINKDVVMENQNFASPIQDIDLRELFLILWRGKLWIVISIAMASVLAVVYAISLPNHYTSEGIYAPAEKQGTGSLIGQYGGLAAMAGISLGNGEGDDIDRAIALISSWPFIDGFVTKYRIKPHIMAVEKWDLIKGDYIWNSDLYDAAKHRWVREPSPQRPSEPTSFETFDAFRSMLSVQRDKKTGLITMSFEHRSPLFAQNVIENLIKEINAHFQERDVSRAQKNIDFLNEKVAETSVAEMKSVFYGMIESQMKNLMLAKVSDEYLLATVVQPMVPEFKSSPARALICVLGALIGCVIGSLIALAANIWRNSKEQL